MVALGAYNGDTLVDWSWVGDHTHEIWARLQEHMELTAYALFWGLLIAVPLALVAYRHRGARAPILGVTGVLYTIPSLAAFVALQPYTGLSTTTVLVPLTAYTLLILIRNVVAGLEAVAPEVRESASGMGYSRRQQLARVEIPLALPTIVGGVRIAAVTLIGLIPVAALVGKGGLGTLMLDGFNRAFQTPLTVGLVLTVALAVAVDALLLGVQRLLSPWSRKAR